MIAEKSVQMALLYSLLSPPLLVPEATGVGQALIEALRPIYDYIYIRELSGKVRDGQKTQKLGFYTNYANKILLIENMKTLFQQNFPKIHDKDIVEELKTFVYTDSALEQGAGAQSNYHDDRIMAMMLAYFDVPAQYVPENEGAAEKFDLYSTRYI